MQPIGPLLKQRVDRIVFENRLMRAGFAALPYSVMADKKLSIGARLTYAFLQMYGWQEGSCFPGQARLAADIGISRAQVQRFLYELRNTEYIRIERADKRFNNNYVMVDRWPTKLRKRKAK